MGIGVLLEIMELVQNHVEEAHKPDIEHVIVLLLLMVEKLVLEVLPVGKLATLMPVQVETLIKIISSFHTNLFAQQIYPSEINYF